MTNVVMFEFRLIERVRIKSSMVNFQFEYLFLNILFNWQALLKRH